jgi:hypothetical protein
MKTGVHRDGPHQCTWWWFATKARCYFSSYSYCLRGSLAVAALVLPGRVAQARAN